MSVSLDVLNLADAGFPTGAHGHSGGLEYAVQAGWVGDRASLEAWSRRALRSSFYPLDLRAALKAWHHPGETEWNALNDEVASFRTSQLQREASAQVGRSFLRSVRSSYGGRAEGLPVADSPDALQFPVAWGSAFRVLGLPAAAMAETLVFGALRQWAQVAMRIVPLGQNDTFAALAALIEELGTPPSGPEDAALPLESLAPGLELAGMGMEHLSKKYFRS